MLRILRIRNIIPIRLNAFTPVTVATSVNSSVFLQSVHTTPKNWGLFGPPQEESLVKRVAKKLGWTETSRSQLHATGYMLYIKIADEVNYLNFFKHCQMDDTFVSWFTVLELHIWMVSARLMQEGKEGKIIRNAMIKAMWEDCDTRSKKLEGALSSARKKQINLISEEFQASMISYDEGLLGNDTVLAGSLWRRFLRHKKSHEELNQREILEQVIALEMLIIYVRSQYYTLHQLSRERLMKRKFDWVPFDNKILKLSDKASAKRAVL